MSNIRDRAEIWVDSQYPDFPEKLRLLLVVAWLGGYLESTQESTRILKGKSKRRKA